MSKLHRRPFAAVVSLLFVTTLVAGGSGVLPAQAAGQPTPQDVIFYDGFDSPDLDPAWEVREFTGERVYGYTSPANHISLTDRPGYLRYGVDEMTYSYGFMNDYQVYVTDYPYDWGLELHRPFSGEQWIFETRADYYLPYTNGRGLDVHIYFGDGGANTFAVVFVRGRDVCPTCNNLGIGLQAKYGPTFDLTYLEGVAVTEPEYGPPESTYFLRAVRDGSILTASWSPDGVTWTQAWSHDMGTDLDGLQQRLVITGLSWFNPAGSYADYDYVLLATALPGLHVNRMKMYGGASLWPGYYKVGTLLLVQDDAHAAAAGATVLGDWTYPDGRVVSRQAKTRIRGLAKLVVIVPQCGTFQFCVTDIVKAGYAYDPAANEDGPCKTITVPCK